MTPEQFVRQLNNLEGMFRRLDSGELTGRNSQSSDDGRRRSYERLRDAVRADAQTDDAPICTMLDARPKLAAKWTRLERRSVGLKP
jgi:hypothetical protein